MNLAQARVMVEALDALPKDLGDDQCAKAEAHLVEQAADFGPRELRRLGRGLLEVIAPDIADEHEYQQLLAEERRAHATTRLHLRPRGDGSTDINARVPDHAANRLRAYLNAYTAPRRRHVGRAGRRNVDTDEFAQLPIDRQRGEAFVALLENIPTTGLPRHGGTATSVMVTLDYATLASGVGRRDHLHRRPDHRRPSPQARLPGRDHPCRPRERRRGRSIEGLKGGAPWRCSSA